MKIKEQLIKIQEKIKNTKKNEFNEADLDTKIDNFINWHLNYKMRFHPIHNKQSEYYFTVGMRNFIEKMAVWYELRYPEYEVNRLMHCCGQEGIEINDVMFKNNPYIKELLDDNSDIRNLDWDEFYNVNAFIKSLPWEERHYFNSSRYRELVYLDRDNKHAHLHLTKKGFVESAEYFTNDTNSIIKDEELEGLHIRDVIKLFKERNVELPEENELEETIKNVDDIIYQKEEMLNCVMYRIIERGGNRIGPRRAFLFAKEFGRNIDIPMMYAVDYSDPGLRLFMNEYLKSGGSKDLICYVGYFARESKDEKMDTISIQDLILTQNNNAASFYTPEEDKLYQRFANAIASQINPDLLNQEKVKKLRIEKK